MKMQISFLIEKNLDLYLMEDAKQFFWLKKIQIYI